MAVPHNYVEQQYQVNRMHSNGALESSTEPALDHARFLVGWAFQHSLPFTSVLDVGCRTGYVMREFKRLSGTTHVEGIDIVPQFVRMAKLRGPAQVADMHSLPFVTAQFDWTFCCATIEHAYDLDTAIDEQRRVARVGIYISTDLEESVRPNPSHHVHHADAAEWAAALKHPDWRLTYLKVTPSKSVDMIWLRKEHYAKLSEV